MPCQPESEPGLCTEDGAAVRQAALTTAETMVARALRVLAFAMVDDEVLAAGGNFDTLAGRTRLLGRVGEIDPPRDEVRLAVAQCHAAGIRPVMVTGDHKLAGLPIAREPVIARHDKTVSDRAFDGLELERMGEADLRNELPQVMG